jgi:hypothetical protein
MRESVFVVGFVLAVLMLVRVAVVVSLLFLLLLVAAFSPAVFPVQLHFFVFCRATESTPHLSV